MRNTRGMMRAFGRWRSAGTWGLLLFLWPLGAISQEGGGGEIPGKIPASGIPEPLRMEIPSDRPGSIDSLMTALEAYEAWLRRFDTRFTEVEEQIARASQGLDGLEFEVLGEVGSRADAVVIHSARPGAFFLLEEIRYQLDGLPIASRIDSTGALGTREPFEVFSGRIVPGKHILTVEMVFRVRGYNLLASSEFRSARFRVKETFRFEAKDGFITQIEVVGSDTGSDSPSSLSLRQIEKRFQITFARTEKKGEISPSAPQSTKPASVPVPASSSAPVSTPQ